jgi:hypothetical protein
MFVAWVGSINPHIKPSGRNTHIFTGDYLGIGQSADGFSNFDNYTVPDVNIQALFDMFSAQYGGIFYKQLHDF